MFEFETFVSRSAHITRVITICCIYTMLRHAQKRLAENDIWKILKIILAYLYHQRASMWQEKMCGWNAICKPNKNVWLSFVEAEKETIMLYVSWHFTDFNCKMPHFSYIYCIWSLIYCKNNYISPFSSFYLLTVC